MPSNISAVQSISSIGDCYQAIATMPDIDHGAGAEALIRQKSLLKPQGSLGRLEEMAVWLAKAQGKALPTMERVEVLIFAANHGVTAREVSPFPSSVTASMVASFDEGIAAISQMSRCFGYGLQVQYLDKDSYSGDIAVEDALSEQSFAAHFKTGFDSVSEDYDALILGEMGIGNTTIAAAIYSLLYGGAAEDWAGAGTGAGGQILANKTEVVQLAGERVRGKDLGPMEIIASAGGAEVAALIGAIVGARHKSVAVVLDGYIVCAAAAGVKAARSSGLDHCLAGHVSSEQGHRRALEHLGLEPLLDCKLCLGEATGAALAGAMLKAAVACHVGMATFEEAGVANRVD